MFIDPESMMRIGTAHLEELRREAAAYRLADCPELEWRRPPRHMLLRLVVGLLGVRQLQSRTPLTTPCDEAPLTSL